MTSNRRKTFTNISVLKCSLGLLVLLACGCELDSPATDEDFYPLFVRMESSSDLHVGDSVIDERGVAVALIKEVTELDHNSTLLQLRVARSEHIPAGSSFFYPRKASGTSWLKVERSDSERMLAPGDTVLAEHQRWQVYEARSPAELLRQAVDGSMSEEESLDWLHKLSYDIVYANPDSAAPFIAALVKQSQSFGNIKYQCIAHHYRYIYFQKLSLLDSALAAARKNIATSTLLGESFALTRALVDAGNCMLELNHSDSAKVYWTKALETAGPRDDQQAARALINLGEFCIGQGEYGQAMHYLQRANDMCVRNNFIGFFGSLNLALGDLYLLLEDYPKALDHYAVALSKTTAMRNNGKRAQTEIKAGHAQLEQGHFREAIDAFTQALETSTMANEPRLEASAYACLADAYVRLAKLDSAEVMANRAKSVMDSLGMHPDSYNPLLQLGLVALKKNQWAKAEALCLNALNASKDHAPLSAQIRACDCLVKAYDGLGKFRESRNYLQMRLDLGQQMLNLNSTRQLAAQQAGFEYQKERQADSLQTVQRLEAERSSFEQKIGAERQTRWIITLVAMILLVIITLALLALRRDRKKTREIEAQRDKITEQESQKDVLLREIHHRVKNNLQTITSLLDLQSLRFQGQEAGKALMESQARVKAIATIHQQLYQRDNMAAIEFGAYLESVTAHMKSLFAQTRAFEIKVKSKTNLELDIDRAIPLSLIVNELVTNAIKHANPPLGALVITIKLENRDREIVLTIADNGQGISQESTKSSGLGMRLTKRLVKQLDATMNMISEEGLRFEIRFNQ